ncbi:MAG: PilZ domain-containing protein [Desulfobacteraceae bacterium]|nr:PilZ domain-containing protein [Desulfobacteraceae bacterium]
MVNQDDTNGSIERRKHERVKFLTSISVKIDTGDKEIEVKGDSKDLSLKGLFIITNEKISIGSPCGVRIILSGTTEDVELHIKGVVARTENIGLGITFDSMDVDSFTYLKNIVKYNSDNN